MPSSEILVVGAGIFGTAAARTLRARGHQVTLLDPGPLPHPLAASTDISKVVRMEYGADEEYMALGEQARAGWMAWNAAWADEGLPPLYHETGLLALSRAPLMPGDFEYESRRLLQQRGHTPETLPPEALAQRFPAWHAPAFPEAIYQPRSGYAESGRVVAALLQWATREGVLLKSGCRAVALLEADGRVTGVLDADGTAHHADTVVVAAGAWTARLVPALRSCLRATGHPVFHLRPPDPTLFQADRFPTFMADVSQTGYYGFPLHQSGVVKVANHGLGHPTDPEGPRVMPRAEFDRLRAFLRAYLPPLADAEIVYTRLCLYADTLDEHFWIDRDPSRAGLVVATGGSGHGFKFGPVLGDLIADAVEGCATPLRHKFRWRPEIRPERGEEASRCHVEHG